MSCNEHKRANVRTIITHEITQQLFKLEVNCWNISSGYFIVVAGYYPKFFELIKKISKSIETVIKKIRKLYCLDLEY